MHSDELFCRNIQHNCLNNHSNNNPTVSCCYWCAIMRWGAHWNGCPFSQSPIMESSNAIVRPNTWIRVKINLGFCLYLKWKERIMLIHFMNDESSARLPLGFKPKWIMKISWWLHQMKTFSAYWPFVRAIHWSLVNSSHKGQWRGALMFSLIWAWINHWVNNGEAGDLRRYRSHYDVIVMCIVYYHFTF